MAQSQFSRPLIDALRRVRRTTDVSLTFAGAVESSAGLRLNHFDGVTVGALDRVLVDVGHGLGGRVVAVGRPVIVNDYRATPTITHRYDAIIASEGLRAMAATPVVVDRKPIAVLYAALRNGNPIGNRTMECLVEEARAVEQQIVATRAMVASSGQMNKETALRDRIAEAYAELRLLVRSLDDPDAIAAVTRISKSLIDGDPVDSRSYLTARESDVLALASVGYGNSRIADLLGVRTETVKGYMKGVMRKLDAHTRLEAVVRARRSKLLP